MSVSISRSISHSFFRSIFPLNAALALALTVTLGLAVLFAPASLALQEGDTPALKAPAPEHMTLLETKMPSKAGLKPDAMMDARALKRPLGMEDAGTLLARNEMAEAMSTGNYGSWTVASNRVTHRPSTTVYPTYVAGLSFQKLYSDDSTGDYSGLLHAYGKNSGNWIVSAFSGWEDNPNIFETDLGMYYALLSQWPSAELFDEQLLEYSDSVTGKATQVQRSFYYHHAGSDGFTADFVTQTLSVAFGNWVYDIWATYPASDFAVFEDAISSYMGTIDFPFELVS